MKHIGIIGAGISGLVTAKTFLQKGYRVTVLEKSDQVGGVWDRKRSYAGVTTQTTRDEYAFSDFPMPASYPLWPTGAQVQEYLENYAQHFGIMPHIRFNVNVENLYFDGYAWLVKLNGRETLSFSYVVVCTGTFHEPHIPEIPGMGSYREAGGIVLHSSAVTDANQLAGRDVAVVGFAKSATDIATLAAGVGKSCTLIYRQAHWKVPRYFGNKVNMKYLLFSRFSEAFFNARRKTVFQLLLHTVGKPLVWMQWRALELLLKKQFRLRECGMVPSHRIEDQISCSLGVEPVGFYKKVAAKEIRAVCTEIECFEGKQVRLKNGQTISPDLVVFGTGFRQRLPFLSLQYQELLTNAKGIYRLYRNILHPDLPQMGFVGFNSSLFTTLTSEIAANWLAATVTGDLILPPAEEMYREIQSMERWRCHERPIASEFSGLCVAPFNFQHLDELMKDMGLRTRASWNIIYEFFKPINPADYKKMLSGKPAIF
ncbi:flavin-containing monooxygenase [Chitinophaga japonensis]|uniref:Cation diffusion facilitator CzcD-associated flavoprotein CzcO n=1 Tax=Chitinophaga japonensis TaxID=104662 RepID=A0A562SYY6_CHIJA|nr:NAD(P)/FAD-dependent oxidoreductase [Chitinophaga japonensis]TWI86383.1 cation diffusion facilitator CzcD-associated flavoprotein CzcO [Chitinophaga japonensis]